MEGQPHEQLDVMGLTDTKLEKECERMPCYYPLPAVKINGAVRVLPRTQQYIDAVREHKMTFNKETGELDEYFFVPCGKCIGCRLEHSRQWANRCVLESLDYPKDQLWWLTLTYNEDNVPRNEDGAGTLVKPDLQLFIKRLRRHFDYNYGVQNIRFFACGEYGTKNWRPHFHVCLFGLPLLDAEIVGKNFRGDKFYNSETINKLWTNGYSYIGELNWQTAAYTARYCLKKWNNNTKETYEKLNITPEYTVMSRRPGIAGGYYEKYMPEIYEYDSIILPAQGGKPMDIRPPKYFDKKFAVDDPEKLIAIKEKRKRAADIAAQVKKNFTTLDEDEYLLMCAENAKKIETKLPRTL